jgi:hypothetical protein
MRTGAAPLRMCASWLCGLALAAAVAASPPFVAACQPCTGAEGCITGAGVTLNLSCGPTDLTGLHLTGACASAQTDGGAYGANDQWVGFGSEEAGACHYTLDFASGYSYSGDVMFTEQSPGCGCPSYLAPSPATIDVPNPSSTCLKDSGAE